jgi:pSer/pThr/pTyr-binding forkhead associated (FHA) protein
MSGRETTEHQIPRPPFGAPHVWILAVIDGEDPRLVHRVDRPETLIGRDGAVDFPIPDGEVSKQHCLVRTDGAVCTVTDLGSRNGTLLNGRPLRKGIAQRLRHLDEIQVGNTRLFLLAGKFKPASPR